jgi:hypothetical protein
MVLQILLVEDEGAAGVMDLAEDVAAGDQDHGRRRDLSMLTLSDQEPNDTKRHGPRPASPWPSCARYRL